MKRPERDGFVLITLVVLMIPMLLMVGAVTTAMTGKSGELRTELAQERCLLAAESGVDDAIYHGETAALSSGVAITRVLGPNTSYTILPTHLETDGLDNDNDTLTDEADEDVFQVIVSGNFRGETRRLAAYLGPMPLLPTITAAMTVPNPVGISLKGTPLISGHNLNMNGTAGAGSLPGLSIATPGTIAQLSSELTGAEPSKVVGSGASPSLGTSTPIDVLSLVAVLQNTANLVLTSSIYNAYNFGSGIAGTTNVAYRNGNVKFGGNTTGAGVLVVTGDLTLSGTFRFDGVVIVLGNLINSAGTVDIYGGLLLGPSSTSIDIKGTFNMHYSAEAVQLATKISGRYVAFNGWQELSR